MIGPVVFIALALFTYALASGRLASTIVTGPLFFSGVGLLAGPVLGLVDVPPGSQLAILLLEAALVMVLFADATSLDFRRLAHVPTLAGRLLGIGLPLTMIAGTVVALALLPGIEAWQAALVGVMLAPTDAALGQAVVANPRVPAVVRNGLNVESGLNDGLALPFVLMLAAIGLASTGAESEVRAIETLVRALFGSTIVGLLVGAAGGSALREAARRGYAARIWQSIGLIAIAVAAFAISDERGGSGFIAAWVAGLLSGSLLRGAVIEEAFHLPEQVADLLTAISFLLLGVALLEPVLARATPQMLLYAVLSLTLVRMVPVAVAMLGSGYARPSVAYVGWFGPRGLASIIFAGVVVEEAVPVAQVVTDVVLLTVGLSIVAHGVTSAWAARRYATWFEGASASDTAIPEAAQVADRGAFWRRTPRGGVTHRPHRAA